MNFTEHFESKIVDQKGLIKLLNLWRFKDEVIVFTNGCFDILHRGHLHVLNEAAALGSKLIVGLNSDSSIKQIKKEGRPLQNETSRAWLLAALEITDAVILFDEPTPKKLIELVKPDFLVKGGDYKPDEIEGREFANQVKIVPFLEGYSTTSIEEKIQKNQI